MANQPTEAEKIIEFVNDLFTSRDHAKRIYDFGCQLGRDAYDADIIKLEARAVAHIQENYQLRSESVSKEEVLRHIPECNCESYYGELGKTKTSPFCTRCELENTGLLDLLSLRSSDALGNTPNDNPIDK